jgi:ketosteroid isomerase-like protein
VVAILEAMSEATDLVYAIATAYNAHDVEAICALCTEDVEIWTFLEGRAEGEPYRGHDGVRSWQENEREAWEWLQVEDPRARDLGNGRALGLATVKGRGRGSGLEIEAETGWIFDTQGGRILRIRTFDDPAQALEAAGHEE